MARKRINPGQLITGTALRHVGLLHRVGDLTYDTSHEAACNQVVLCELVRLPRIRFDRVTHTGIEEALHTPRGLSVRASPLREGLVAVTVGDRYAPRNITGGLFNPLTGKRNGIIRGGAQIHDLFGLNLAGFINHSAVGEERAQLRVLGTLLDESGAPLRLQAAPVAPRVARRSVQTIVVTGSSMESGKTTCCIAIAAELHARGISVSFEKKTGSACMRDILRVGLGRHEILGKPGETIRVADVKFPVADIVDITGNISDCSQPVAGFVRNTLRAGSAWQSAQRSHVHIIELADNFEHRTNLALLTNARFAAAVTQLVYVPDASFDAADHALRRIRAMPRLGRMPLAFSGPLANDLPYAALREEISARLRVPCLASRDAAGAADGCALVEWFLSTKDRP